jgi:predicted O-methyltransferase YrrM
MNIYWNLSQNKWEITKVFEFLEGKGISNVLEIGSYCGGSGLVWATLVSSQGVVWLVDLIPPKERLEYHVYEQGDAPRIDLENYLSHPFKHRIVEIKGDSHHIDIKRLCYQQRKFDFLFVDGDHTKEGVKEDFEAYSKCVRSGGWIGFHDILDTEEHRRKSVLVSEFWDEIKNKYNRIEFIAKESKEMGIGLIEWQ